MNQTGPAPAGNPSLAERAAITALGYHGLLFLAAKGYAAYVILLMVADQVTDHDLDAWELLLFTAILVVLTTLFAAPTALAAWLFLAVRRNDPPQVAWVLAIFSVILVALAAICLPSAVGLYPGPDTYKEFAILSENLAMGFYVLLPSVAIVALGWVGRTRMRRTVADAGDDGQVPHLTSGNGAAAAQ